MVRNRAIITITILSLVFLTSVVCQAQSLPLLTGHVREGVADGQALSVGRLPTTQVLNFDIVLPLRDRAGLQDLVRKQYDPTSSFYHQFLTPQEVTERFGPSQEDWDALVAFAQASGFEIIGGDRDGRDLWLKGAVGNIERAFHVTLGLYKDPADGHTFYSPDHEPTVNLPFQLWHITGLDNNSRPHPLYVKKSDYAKAHGIATKKVKSNATGSGPGGSFLGSDMRAAYYQGTTLTGSGQNIALFELAGSDLVDLSTYYSNVGQTEPYIPTLVSTGGYATTCVYSSGCDDTEQTIDMTQAMGMAPGSTMLYNYVCGNVKANGTGNFSDTACISAMVTTTAAPLSKQISCSWGWNPADASTLDPYFEQMASQGQNFFAASGDSGKWTSSNYAWPADDANVVSVGGTDLTTSGAAGPWSSETAWVDGGGGNSPAGIPIPSWQIPVDSCSGCSTTLRNGPDVAAEANFDFYYCADQQACNTGLGGTSFAAPMWAGYLALANQQAAANGQTIGFINPIIYPAAEGSGYSTLFHDITSGSCTGDSAGTGYDLCTGWGSPKTNGLINLLAGSSPSFSLSASPSSLTITQGGNGTSTITVTSLNGFNSATTLSASGLPSGVTAGFSPNPVTPPANGNVTSTLTLTASPTAATGTVTVTVTGTSGSTVHSTTITLTVNAAASPNFTISASPASLTIVQGNAGTSTITITSQNSFNSATTLTASGLPSGVTAAFSTNPVTPPANGSATSTLTLTASAGATVGTTNVTVTGTSGSLTHSTTIALTVNSSVGLQTATYNATLKAPACASVGSGCDSGPSLLLGRDNLSGGAEPNQPNTINSSCADGTSGTFHSDESNDRLVVQTIDGSALAPGKTVKVSATVWAYSSYTSDHLDLYYAANASSPSWVLIGTITPTAAGAQTLSANYTLPTGGASQAVRAQFRYNGSASSCTTGSYNDHDDLVFAVGAGTPGFTVSASPSAVSVAQGSNASSTITVTSQNGFNSATTLSVSGLPSGVTAAFSTNPVTPPANGSATSTLTFTASGTATTGTTNVTVTGTSGSLVQNTTIALTVTTAGGAQTAVYDSTLKTPKCATVGSSCDSGSSLLLGRDSISGGAESHQPNTINNSCSDGTSGTFHSDESNDRLVVATTDGSPLAGGKTVTVTATVWAWNTGSSDALDLYYTANANSPSWVLIGTIVPSAGGQQTISRTYTLPTGSTLQAVRANFRYQGSASACSTGAYDDHDDLVFATN